MYELTWDGPVHSPFESGDPSDLTKLKSKFGTTVLLIGDVANVLDELHLDPEWAHVDVGILSQTDEPTWARKLLQKIMLPQSKVPLETVFTSPWELSVDTKTKHFEPTLQATGVALESMLFFDNEAANCCTVSKQGVSVCYCPNGVTRQAFNKAIECFFLVHLEKSLEWIYNKRDFKQSYHIVESRQMETRHYMLSAYCLSF